MTTKLAWYLVAIALVQACVASAFVLTNPLRDNNFVKATKTLDFDFSSTLGWEDFYNKTTTDFESHDDVIEWHSSISFATICSYIPLHSQCLLVGCGNSHLPDAILRHNNDNNNSSHDEYANTNAETNNLMILTLLDSSPSCVASLQKRYANEHRIKCVVADATRLSRYFCSEDAAQDQFTNFDVIVDKGLLDALLCNEGWNESVERLFTEAAQCLRPTKGVYLLISYKLPKSTREFLVQVGHQVGLEWSFDLPGTNDLVGISTARKHHHSCE